MYDDPTSWNDDEVREYFDNNWGVTVYELAAMTGLDVAEVCDILVDVECE